MLEQSESVLGVAAHSLRSKDGKAKQDRSNAHACGVRGSRYLDLRDGREVHRRSRKTEPQTDTHKTSSQMMNA